jgi:hypothetical protein
MGERFLANLFGDNEIVSTNYPANGAYDRRIVQKTRRFPFEPEPSHWVALNQSREIHRNSNSPLDLLEVNPDSVTTNRSHTLTHTHLLLSSLVTSLHTDGTWFLGRGSLPGGVRRRLPHNACPVAIKNSHHAA